MKQEQLSMFDNKHIKELNTTDYTYKSPNLIMSSYELSLTEQRIIALGCKKIRPIYIEKKITPNDLKKVLKAMEFSDIEISTSEYRDEYGIKGNNIYDSLEKYANKLYEERSIDYFDENNKLRRKRWVSSSTFDRENGKVLLTFNIDMIPDLLVLKGKFVALHFDMSNNVKSKYAFRNYEILKNHLYLGKFKISVEEYRFMLQITDKYSDFGELNRKVIKPNIKIINEHSDIFVTYKPIRCGITTKWIEFTITSKSKNIIEKENDFKKRIPTAFSEISTALNKYGIELTSEDADKLFNSAIEITQLKYKDKDAVSFILDKIKVLDNYVLNKKVDNIIGFLNTAIQKDWKVNFVDKTPKKLNFDNFEPREYDYKELESKSIEWLDDYNTTT